MSKNGNSGPACPPKMVRWPKADPGAELVLKQHFSLYSIKGPTIAIPTLIIVGNRKGFEFLSQVFAYAAKRRLYSSAGDPDDHLHWGRRSAPINRRLSDDIEFRLGTYGARAREKTLLKYGMTRAARGRGDAVPRYRALIEKIEDCITMEERATAEYRARLRSGLARKRFDESRRIRDAVRAFLRRGAAPEPRLAATTAQEESRLLNTLSAMPFGDRGIERFSLDGVRRFLLHLSRSNVPYLQAGALSALDAAESVLECLDEFRTGATHSDWRVRAAAAFGLHASPYLRDELLLWSLFADDKRPRVRTVAAEALSLMRRAISATRFRAALREMRGRPTLVLAERARNDERLYAYTRGVLMRRWAELCKKRWTQWSFDHFPEAFGFAQGAEPPHGFRTRNKRRPQRPRASKAGQHGHDAR